MLQIESISFIQDFINKRRDTVNELISGTSNKAKKFAGDKLNFQVANRVSHPIIGRISTGPLAEAGVTAATGYVNQLTDRLISIGLKKINEELSTKFVYPLRQTPQDLMDGFFATVALASTAHVEIVMELARSNARLTVEKIKQKDILITAIKKDIEDIYRAMTTVLRADPFFKDYFDKLLDAYAKILSSQTDLRSVVKTLRNLHKYNKILFDRAIVRLEVARNEMQPPQTVKVYDMLKGTPLEEIADFFTETPLGVAVVSAVTGKKSGEEALAAALTIPIISARLGEKYVRYVFLTVQINTLIQHFMTALDEFITQYKRNDNIDQAAINHIQAGINQLDTLLSDMKVQLFPDVKKTSQLYQAEVTTAATGWILRLDTVIEWLKNNPARTAASLDVTGESVTRYQAAVKALKDIGNLKHGIATLTVKEAQENPVKTTAAVGKLLLQANVVIATQTPPQDIKLMVFQLRDTFSAAITLDSKIISALTPFINTPFELLNGATKVVNQLLKVAEDLGLERATELMKYCDLNGFYAMNAQTATFAGAAVVGLDNIIGLLRSKPGATDNDVQKCQLIRDDMARKNETQRVESQRSSAASTDRYIAKQKLALASDEADAASAINVAKQQDASIENDPVTKAENAVSRANGNRLNMESQ